MKVSYIILIILQFFFKLTCFADKMDMDTQPSGQSQYASFLNTPSVFNYRSPHSNAIHNTNTSTCTIETDRKLAYTNENSTFLLFLITNFL